MGSSLPATHRLGQLLSAGSARRRLQVDRLVCLGGFKNLRRDYAWEGFKLELDETQFDWGTVYEVEVETVRPAQGLLAGCAAPARLPARLLRPAAEQERPEELKEKLERFLRAEGIPFSYSEVTKFHNFVNKSLL